MGINYEKCDMCKRCYDDCGDNYPIEVEGTDKNICPCCMEEWCNKKGTKIIYVEDVYGEELPMYMDEENYYIKKEYSPFIITTIAKQKVKEVLMKEVYEALEIESKEHLLIRSFERLGL